MVLFEKENICHLRKIQEPLLFSKQKMHMHRKCILVTCCVSATLDGSL